MHASTNQTELASTSTHKRASANGRFLQVTPRSGLAQKREMAEGVLVSDR